MIRSLWISKTGLDAQQTQMDVISNNLANVSTNGFKRSRAVFEDLLYQNIRQPGAQSSQQTQLPSGLQLGTGVRPVATERIFTQGNLQQTGNDKDVAIQGSGFFRYCSRMAPPPTHGTALSRLIARVNWSLPAAFPYNRRLPCLPILKVYPSRGMAQCPSHRRVQPLRYR